MRLWFDTQHFFFLTVMDEKVLHWFINSMQFVRVGFTKYVYFYLFPLAQTSTNGIKENFCLNPDISFLHINLSENVLIRYMQVPGE